uniref:CRC domain-containing protein n=1 Tax=Heliothis virescens TaxID=7102 RepID=A0A2A4IX14_HELVI
MEHNLDDSLNLESAMGSMDFDHSGVVVSQEDISLETTGHEPDIPMEFENIEEQQMLMDTGGEEIIVSEFINDQYSLQEYSVQDDSAQETSGLDEGHGLNVMQSQGESMIDLQFDTEIPQTVTQEAQVPAQPKYIAVKAAAPPRRKNETIVTSNPPRQVAIAPKPPKLVPASQATFTSGAKHNVAIAPKPVTMVKNSTLVKKMSLASVLQGGSKTGNTLLTQIGKQLVMVPAGGGQKIKLVTSSSGMQSVQFVRANSDQAELIKNVGGTNTQKPVLAKVIVQGQAGVDPMGQSAVITKLMPSSSSAAPQTRYVMQQKTVPISIGSSKVLLASPTKQGVKFAKKQIIAIKSPTPKLMPMTSQGTTKKVVITSNPSQNVILKTTAPPKTAQISKDGNVVISGQRSQLHQINVPGKGIQYIRLITNPTPAPQKVALKAQNVSTAVPAKSFVLTDNKAQIGKQLVMVPAGGGQKIKLVTSSSGMQSVQFVRANSDQAELIKNVGGTNTQKPVLAKVIVQGQAGVDPMGQSAVITKLMPSSSSAAPQTRYVMQQKTVPISIGSSKVLLASPTKQGVKFAKKQIIAIKSPTPKLMPMTSQGTTKKVVITSNPSQNVILKTTAPPKTAQISKDGNVVISGQRSQLHQINVPGKGIQYIRLITNPTPAPQKVALKAQNVSTAVPAKSFVLTDNKVTTKPQKKLVRIAPIAMKPSQPVQQQQSSRSSQSLLAPLSPLVEPHMEDMSELLDAGGAHDDCDETELRAGERGGERGEDERESKAALRALIADTVADDTQDGMQEVEVDFERHQTPDDDDNTNSMEHDSSNRSEEHPLIVIPSSYGKQGQMRDDSYSNMDQDSSMYLSPKASQALSESDVSTDLVAGDLGLRPRKACNCTKSQCLKLYCDCFANGEFCNRCNCNNCHNNLENEELRQKAIRACLDRNPNAFRPKIGKAKSGGPDIIRRHNKGCNCKRSGCLKNYCECYEAKIACTSMCKCVGCRNVEETLERRRDLRMRDARAAPLLRPPPAGQLKQPCSFMTSEVIEAVCQCLLAAGVEGGAGGGAGGVAGGGAEAEPDPLRDVIEEFARCLQDIISASHQSTSLSVIDDGPA